MLVDGVSYRDVRALQEGISLGGQGRLQGFQQGYFPVSRLVSTFPSVSDPAWSEILGDRPPPGYQRTYLSAAEGSQISLNGVTSSAEYEKQMSWQLEGDWRRLASYVFPLRAFRYEVNALVENFLHAGGEVTNYYAFIHSTDSAQHLWGDIGQMLCALDEKLQELRALYRAREGRELEILILSDHGNNHAGGGKRVAVRSFLERAGYRITKSIGNPKDIVLPTAGVESWVEIHNAPAETERLVQLLAHLKGVDVLTAQAPEAANRFIVANAKGERAVIEWNEARNSFRYSSGSGDPIGYRPVVEALSQKHELDADGFASADAWMGETMTHRYPLALERIVRGHTRVTLNPATILISLRNDYIHSGWLIKRGIVLVKSGGTHGGLDDLSSNGMLLSSFMPTKDTSTARVAALCDGFKGLRDYRSQESGAEWLCGGVDGMKTIAKEPLGGGMASAEELFLRIWTPAFTRLRLAAPIQVTIEQARHFLPAVIRRTDPKPIKAFERCLTLDHPLAFPDTHPYERVYALPAELILEPQTLYHIAGRIREEKRDNRIFEFTFRTDERGVPVAR